MSIADQITDEMKDAMRSKDEPRLDVLRQIRTEISKAKTAPGFTGPVDDALYQQIISAYCKKMEKAKQEFDAAGERGKELSDKLAFEINYLRRWLPQKMTEAETVTLVETTIASLGAKESKDAGRVLGAIMKEHKDTIDGALVNKLVRAKLNG